MENLPDLDIPFFMIGLNDVLYDPESGDIIIPNMNQFANVKDPSKYPAREGNSNLPAPEDTDDGDDDKEKEEDKDESNDKS